MKTIFRKNLAILLIFGIGMGFLEAIVVIYLRHIYYPDGFRFPLTIISGEIYFAEIIREICTIIMLLAISVIAARNKLQILAYFFYSFAVWDIFYYVALKLFLNWPLSPLTWDVLFLIPITWLGPVLAPVVCSITMIIFSLVVLSQENKQIDFKITIIQWVMLFMGFLLIFVTFIWDYAGFLISKNFLNAPPSQQTKILETFVVTHIPTHYNWVLFLIGLASIYLSIFLIAKKSNQQSIVLNPESANMEQSGSVWRNVLF